MKKILVILMLLVGAIGWRPSGAEVLTFAVSGGANEVYTSSLAPFHAGEVIRIDSEVMVVTGVGAAFGHDYLIVWRTQRAVHNIFAPIYLAAIQIQAPV